MERLLFKLANMAVYPPGGPSAELVPRLPVGDGSDKLTRCMLEEMMLCDRKA